MHDYREAELSPRERALCDFAVALTQRAAEIAQADIDALRAHGLDDATISDAIQVVGYFNYVNRVADGLGVELEEPWPANVRRERRYGFRDRSMTHDFESGGSE